MVFSNPNILRDDSRLYARSLVRGFRVHNERLLERNGEEWREWNPNQSKFAAAIMRGLKANVPEGACVLYLGAANGATASFVSDLVGENGAVYCVEISPRAMRDLINVCERRGNMFPILADARNPLAYKDDVSASVDLIYEDVADPSQAGIMVENGKAFLQKGGLGMIAVKARCVSSAEAPERVYARVEAELSHFFTITERLRLEPYERDHEFLVLRRR